MLDNRVLARRFVIVLSVPVFGAGLIGAAQLLAPSSDRAATELVGAGGDAARNALVGGAPSSSSTAAESSSVTSTDAVTPAAAQGSAATGPVVRGRRVFRGPATAPAGASVLFTLAGPGTLRRVDRTAPFATTVDTRALPDGAYRLVVQVLSGGHRTTVATSRLTIANHAAPGAATGSGSATVPGAPTTSGAAPGTSTAVPTTTTPPRPSTTTTSSSSTPSRTSTTTTRPSTSTRAPQPTSTTTRPATSGTFADQVVQLTNAERRTKGCPALTVDPKLTAVALAHSEDMARRGFFDHANPDGKSPFDRMTAAGYVYRTAAENIAAGQRTPQDVVTAWMNSPGHRENILNCSLAQIGVGYATGGQYGAYWTQDFGTPR